MKISTRDVVGTDDDVLIGGLIVFGDDDENVLVGAIGPDLTGLGVPNASRDPALEIHDAAGRVIASNDDWRSDQEDEITAAGIASHEDRDAASLLNLFPGIYTAIVRGAGDTTDVTLVEIYDLDPDHCPANCRAHRQPRTGANRA